MKRMAFAAAACAFFDVPLPRSPLDYLEDGTTVGVFDHSPSMLIRAYTVAAQHKVFTGEPAERLYMSADTLLALSEERIQPLTEVAPGGVRRWTIAGAEIVCDESLPLGGMVAA